jgi:hypothetical protein
LLKPRALFLVVVISSLLLGTAQAAPSDYYEALVPGEHGNTSVSWLVTESPDTPFSLFWSGTDSWLALQDTAMNFIITAIDDDVEGTLALGNASWTSSDTEIAKDLTLGVWGATPFLPGLVIEVGQANRAVLNATALASANRTYGNYMNGTMTIGYQTVETQTSSYYCITFDYVQDTPSFGEPQKTYLAYDNVTGILVLANTSYSFGIPYAFSIELQTVLIPYAEQWLVAAAFLSIGVITVVVLFVGVRRINKD